MMVCCTQKIKIRTAIHITSTIVSVNITADDRYTEFFSEKAFIVEYSEYGLTETIFMINDCRGKNYIENIHLVFHAFAVVIEFRL